MAKGAGDTRVSTWRKAGLPLTDDLYYTDGQRKEFYELDQFHKDKVKEVKRRIQNDMYEKLKDVSTPQTIDDGKVISVNYTKSGLKHFCNNAMVNLSGKYFSETSMMNIDSILAKSKYVPTSHGLSHSRDDARTMWFKYKDADGRGVYFGVCWDKRKKIYELYSVTDKI